MDGEVDLSAKLWVVDELAGADAERNLAEAKANASDGGLVVGGKNVGWCEAFELFHCVLRVLFALP